MCRALLPNPPLPALPLVLQPRLTLGSTIDGDARSKQGRKADAKESVIICTCFKCIYVCILKKQKLSVFSRFSSEMKRTFTQPLFAKETNRTVEGCVSLTKINLNLREVVNKKKKFYDQADRKG